MTHQDILQCADADQRTKVYAVIHGFTGKCDLLTVQDAINMEMADRYQNEDDLADETRRQREEREVMTMRQNDNMSDSNV